MAMPAIFGSFGTCRSAVSLCEPLYDLLGHGIGTLRDLPRRLVLYGMGYINSFEPGAAQGAGLNPRRGGEFCGRYRHSGNAQVFKMDGVVQTARGA